MSLYNQFQEYIENDDSNEKFVPLLSKIKWDCIEDTYRSIIRKKIKLDMEDGIFDTNFKISNRIMSDIHIDNQRRTKEKQEQEKPCYMITINLSDDKFFNELFNEVISFTRSVWFSEGYITFEQRGESDADMGTGIHCHILMIKYNIKFSLLQKNLTRKFGRFVNLLKLRETLNISNKPRNELDKILDEYIFQNGKQEEKQTKIEIDKEWREKIGIEAHYHFSSILGERTGLTTDKRPVQQKADGRTRNGGARKGAGAPKGNNNRKGKTPKKKSPIEDFDIEFVKQKKVLEF